jgi:hypothetical protein
MGHKRELSMLADIQRNDHGWDHSPRYRSSLHERFIRREQNCRAVNCLVDQIRIGDRRPKPGIVAGGA